VSIRLVDGKWLIVGGQLATDAACCCPPPPPPCEGECDEENPCPEGCYCCEGECQSEPCEDPPTPCESDEDCLESECCVDGECSRCPCESGSDCLCYWSTGTPGGRTPVPITGIEWRVIGPNDFGIFLHFFIADCDTYPGSVVLDFTLDGSDQTEGRLLNRSQAECCPDGLCQEFNYTTGGWVPCPGDPP